MGLDMYLKAKRYVSEYTDKELYEKINSFDFGQKDMMINQIECEALYWRKANAIHEWFVNNCQDGVDDCRDAYVSIQKLKTLRDLCAEVLNNRDRADELLPSVSGFFFGPTDYDDWYFDAIERTEKGLTKILEDGDLIERWDFYYHSSW